MFENLTGQQLFLLVALVFGEGVSAQCPYVFEPEGGIPVIWGGPMTDSPAPLSHSFVPSHGSKYGLQVGYDLGRTERATSVWKFSLGWV